MVELVFRTLKSIIYKELFNSIKEVENKVVDLLKSETLETQLNLLFKETIQQYIRFIKDRINLNIN